MVDFKIRQIQKVDNTYRIDITIYEGGVTTAREIGQDVTRYRRSRVLRRLSLKCHETEYEAILSGLNQLLATEATARQQEVIPEQTYAENIRPTIFRELRAETTAREPVV